jgi:hypothetical protein
MPVTHGEASWPGAISVESATYTCSHGISPGCAVLHMQPQDAPIDLSGTLVITDGNESITLPGCKVNGIKAVHDGNGLVWVVDIVDRRWRWKDQRFVNLVANQNDPNGKFLPWTLFSPAEIAERCLIAAGETNYSINLPAGLPHALGKGFVEMLRTGINWPAIGINPPTNFDHIPPMIALDQFVNRLGCRVIYQISTDSVLIAPLGVGNNLPDGPLESETPALKVPDAPDAVGVVGDYLRFQPRLLLEPVGLEYDLSLRPIDALSYAPRSPGSVQEVTITINVLATGTGTFKVTLTHPVTGAVAFATAVADGLVAAEISDALFASLTGIQNAIVPLAIDYTRDAGSAQQTIKLSSTALGQSFGFAVRIDGAGPDESISAQLTKAPTKPGVDWTLAEPPLFAGLDATNRLTRTQVIDLAQRSVWKIYRIKNVNISGSGPIIIPGFKGSNGKPIPIKFRQQLILQPTQVDQIVPQPGDQAILNDEDEPLVMDIYRGLSKDVPAKVYGSVAITDENRLVFQNRLANTSPYKPIFYPSFSIDPEQQTVNFTDFVYLYNDDDFASVVRPTLALQTAVLVRDEVTNQIARFIDIQSISPEGTTDHVKLRTFPDIQVNVRTTWAQEDDTIPGTDIALPPNTLKSVQILEADPLLRAAYYLQAMKREFTLTGGLIRKYLGIAPIDCDGAIQQVSWSVGEAGADTTAGYNCEPDTQILAYPQRRRAEALPPILEQQAQSQSVGSMAVADIGKAAAGIIFGA